MLHSHESAVSEEGGRGADPSRFLRSYVASRVAATTTAVGISPRARGCGSGVTATTPTAPTAIVVVIARMTTLLACNQLLKLLSEGAVLREMTGLVITKAVRHQSSVGAEMRAASLSVRRKER